MLSRGVMKFGSQWAMLAVLGKKICDLAKMPDAVQGAEENLISQSVETEGASETVSAENSIDRAELEEMIAFCSFKESTNAASQVDDGVEVSAHEMKELPEIENELMTTRSNATPGRDDEQSENLKTGVEISNEKNRSEICDSVSRFFDDSFWMYDGEPSVASRFVSIWMFNGEPSIASRFLDDPQPTEAGDRVAEIEDIAVEVDRVPKENKEIVPQVAFEIDGLQPKIDPPENPDPTKNESAELSDPKTRAMLTLVNDSAGTSGKKDPDSVRTHRREVPVSDDLWEPYRRQRIRRPKHTKNPFFAFKNAMYWQVRSEMPHAEDRHEIMQEIVRRWHNLPQKTKDDYKTVASSRGRSVFGMRSQSIEAAKNRLALIVPQESKGDGQ